MAGRRFSALEGFMNSRVLLVVVSCLSSVVTGLVLSRRGAEAAGALSANDQELRFASTRCAWAVRPRAAA